ncbi:hypothetical protein [Bacillus sp. AFS040349]|uniref:hypothetical protein n=1 Tax=Bacillus sp. AFS040349 TaxID=2033502 RepID=UPI000BFD6330|nr:hypothetical protein [Bacillus sp. AFS040349]PGT80582.1 hypothetical protein COD11_20950 [Bacillus sp. AFS040349]
MKAFKQKGVICLLTLMTVLILSFSVSVPQAFATDDDETVDTGAWSKAGITPNGGIDAGGGIYDDLDKVVYFVMALGGFWIIIMLVIGGMLLAGSNGNPQRRSAGLVSLACAFGGGWVIMKAYDIAGWIAAFGA